MNLIRWEPFNAMENMFTGFPSFFAGFPRLETSQEAGSISTGSRLLTSARQIRNTCSALRCRP